MKLLRSIVAFAILSAISIVNATPLPVDDSTGEAAPILGRACKPLSKPKGRLFNIDGKTQYFAGTNAWWLAFLRENSDVDLALSQIAKTGYKVVRAWAFGNTNDPAAAKDNYFQVLNSTGQYFNYDPANGIPRLDYVVAAAETYGLQLVLTLNNNWDDLGGIDTYARAFNTTHNGFYTNKAAQAAYKKYIKLIVNRYKHSCAIFAWQLANEVRCSQCDTSVIYNWAEDTSAYIKSLDPHHMVSLGDEGWLASPQGDGSYAYSGYEGVDFAKNLEIPTLDYGTFHLYPNNWGYNYSWGNAWIEQHNAVGKAVGKPAVLEEYGVPDPNFREGVMFQWQDTVVTKTSVAYDSFWQFGTKFASGINPYDEFAIYYGSGEYNVLAKEHVADVNAKKAQATL